MKTTSRFSRALAFAGVAALCATPLSSAVGQQVGAPVGVADIEAATSVESVTVSPLAPVPNVGAGATYFAPEEIRQSVGVAQLRRRDSRWASGGDYEGVGVLNEEALCNTVYQASAAVITTGAAAEAATRAALDARAAAARGQGDAAVLERTELARQAAVRAYEQARSALDEADMRVRDIKVLTDSGWEGVLLPAEIERRTAMRDQYGAAPPEEYDDLRLSEVKVREVLEGGQASLEVSGRIFNTRPRAIPVPPLTVGVLDRGGFVIKTQQIEARRAGRIPARGSAPFTATVRPSPDYAARATVTFGPLQQYPKWLSPDCQKFIVGARPVGRPPPPKVNGGVRQFRSSPF